MKIKLKLLSVKQKSFVNDDGDEMDYFWYKAQRMDNEVSIQVGSVEGDLPLETIAEYEVEKSERVDKKGKVRYSYKIVMD